MYEYRGSTLRLEIEVRIIMEIKLEVYYVCRRSEVKGYRKLG